MGARRLGSDGRREGDGGPRSAPHSPGYLVGHRGIHVQHHVRGKDRLGLSYSQHHRYNLLAHSGCSFVTLTLDLLYTCDIYAAVFAGYIKPFVDAEEGVSTFPHIVGEEQKIKCPVVGHPGPESYYWQHNTSTGDVVK